jgi:hypothetical protein
LSLLALFVISMVVTIILSVANADSRARGLNPVG